MLRVLMNSNGDDQSPMGIRKVTFSEALSIFMSIRPSALRHARNGDSLPLHALPEGSTTNPAAEPIWPWYAIPKLLSDYILAAALLLVLGPIMLIAALIVKLTSRGPAFYSQTRMGLNGRCFTLFKLRTMVHNAEALTGPVWAASHDARITPLGRFLRSSKIDEFPQLINVLRGDMSLVGPRPERPEFVSKLEWQVPGYSNRVRVRPGITGLAQLKLPPDTDLVSVERKLAYDLFYVEHANPGLDFRIICFTVCYFAKVLWFTVWKRIALPTCEPEQRAHSRTRAIASGLNALTVVSIGRPAPFWDDRFTIGQDC